MFTQIEAFSPKNAIVAPITLPFYLFLVKSKKPFIHEVYMFDFGMILSSL